MFIEVEDRSEIDCLFAVLSLGLYTAIENGAISTDEAERYLFLPSTMTILQEVGASEASVDLAHRALFIDDVKRLIPDRFPNTLNTMKLLALSIIQSLPETSETKDTWLKTSPKRKSPIKAALHSLLRELDGISSHYEELDEDSVKSQMYKAIYKGFIVPGLNYVPPEEFGLPDAAGNLRVRAALSHFLTDPEVEAARTELQTAEERLRAFQDPYIRWEGVSWDGYFDYHAEP